jgi:hypothetical protein
MLCSEYLTEDLQRLYMHVSLRPPLTSAVTSFRLFRGASMRLVLVLSTYLYGVTLEIGDKEVHH